MITINNVLLKLEEEKINLKEIPTEANKSKRKIIVDEIRSFYYNSFLSKINKDDVDSIKSNEKILNDKRKVNILNIFHFITCIPFLISVIILLALFFEGFKGVSFEIILCCMFILLNFISGLVYDKAKENLKSLIKEKIKEITMETVTQISNEKKYDEKMKQDLKELLVEENYLLELNKLNILNRTIEDIINKKENDLMLDQKENTKEKNITYQKQLNFLINKTN